METVREAVLAKREEEVGWKSAMCGLCRAFGFAGGLMICGLQLIALAAVVWIFFAVIL